MLVKWHDLPEFENSWECADMISKQFSVFPLEDKVKLLGEGNDRTRYFPKTCMRKTKKANDSSGNTLTSPKVYPLDPSHKEQ